MKENIPVPNWKFKLHEIIYEADTPAGKFFDIAILVVKPNRYIFGFYEIVDLLSTLSAEFSKATDKPITNTQVSPNCNETRHLNKAEFGHNCGYKLNA